MLQIVQGLYFREVPLTNTLHRAIFYTNLRSFGDCKTYQLKFGSILPSTNFDGLSTLTIEAREQLETLTESGGPEVLAATSGDQLLDEIAAVISFGLNITCARDHDLARRVIARSEGGVPPRRGAASILRQTCDAAVVLRDEAVRELDSFFASLVALNRKSYEAAIRAIRQTVDAMLMVDQDASLSYTLMVAALESLGQAQEPPPARWDEYHEQKRARIDNATKGLEQNYQDQIRAAVLANEHHSLSRRFVSFVLDHIEPSYFRDEAVDAIRPINSAELPAALRHAYGIRSRNVHELELLAAEVWSTGERADSVQVRDDILLSLEGLARLARHVIRRYVERASKEIDTGFNYRTALPGIIYGHWAPQYWIHQADSFTIKTAPAYLDGMIKFLIEGMAKRSEAGLVDMTTVLYKIEATALGFSDAHTRLPMAGIMTLWNRCAPKDQRRSLKKKLRERFEADMAEANIVSFAIKVLLGDELPWQLHTLKHLAESRQADRLRKESQPLPKRIDAALHIVVASHLLATRQRGRGLAELAKAVEIVPGIPDLIKFEAGITKRKKLTFNLQKFILGEGEFVA